MSAVLLVATLLAPDSVSTMNLGSNLQCFDYPGKRPLTVCVRSISKTSRDLDALGFREVMVGMKVGIVVTVAVSE